MWYYPASGLINSLTLTILGIFVFLRNRKALPNITYFIFCFFISFWSYSYFLWQISKTSKEAFFWCQMLMAGAVFIPAAYFHFVTTLINKHTDKGIKKLIYFGYLLAGIFAILNFTPLMIIDVRPRLKFPFWPTAGIAYKYFLLYFAVYASYGCYLLLKEAKHVTGTKRNQYIYVFIGSAVGYLGGATNFPLWYDIKLYPVGNILSSIYVALVGYAIIKYRLMDIKVAITRAGIFAVVYVLVLGLPFVVIKWLKPVLISLLGENWWIAILVFGMGLASAGPSIFLFLQHRAEAILLKEQRHYQEILRKLSATLTLIKDLNRLLKLVVLRVARAVKVDFACVYLANENKLIQKNPYTIKGFFPDFPKELSFDSELIHYISSKRKSVFAEELVSMADGFNLRSGLIVPSFVRKRLLGFLVLGPKTSGAIYTQEDANMFGILANQLALAIENSQFIDEHERTQAELFSKERMASLGTMAGGMTHQINNRFNAISMATSDTIDTFKFIDLENNSKQELKDYLQQIKHALTRIQENALRGGKLVNDFLNFSQPDRLQKEAKIFNLSEPLERGIEMARIKTAFAEDTIQKEIQESPLLIRGSFEMIQDMYFNITDNAVDALDKKDKAIKNKELPQPESGYKGKVVIRMSREGSFAVTKIQDNGIGMTKEQLEKLFTPFFTTKATAIKGTGFGLFVIYKIIEAHDGTIEVESEYGKGTTFTIKLPLAKEEEENNEP